MKHLQGLIIIALIAFGTVAKGQGIKKFTAQNRVGFEYEIVLPNNYSKSKSYELAVVFSELENGTDAHSATVESLKRNQNLNNIIYFVPKVPVGEQHWISHPVHHGLNDFMKNMRKEYGQRDQKFHFIGHLFGGRVAQTYSGMSSEYVASVSFAHSKHWTITKQEYFDEIFQRRFKVYVYDTKKSDIPMDLSKANFTLTDNFAEAIGMIDSKSKSL